MLAARSQLRSDQVQVDANKTALEGVREEERVGQRTLLDVLNAEQELLDSRIQLAQTRREVVVTTYRVLAVVGRLTAEALALETDIYDAEENYHQVRNKWFGVSITHRDGRKESIEIPLAEDELLDDIE
jgi:outer membrane protein